MSTNPNWRTEIRRSSEDRFLDKISPEPNTGCWLWAASANHVSGYGMFARERARQNGTTTAHRFAWELYRGPVPDGMCVLHKCDVYPCCNPDHLFLGTKADNSTDMRNKLRFNAAIGKGMRKLTDKQVMEIRKLDKVGGIYRKDIARVYGICPTAVTRLLKGKSYWWVK